MILLASTASKLQVVTGAAVTTAVHASWVDNASGTVTPGATNTPISTATTTDVVAAPGASTYRNIKFLAVRNTHASSSQTVTIQHTDGTNVVPLWAGTLLAGMSVNIDDRGTVIVISAGGLQIGPQAGGALFNSSTASQGAGFATDTYVTGSNILIPAQRPRIGTKFRCSFDVSKTAAGVATPIVQLRYGTNASTADTSLCSFTFSAGTAATDVASFEIYGVYRSVGSGTSAVVQGRCTAISQPTTGNTSLIHAVQTTSAGHDSTTASTYLGVSFNGGTSYSGTIQLVEAELVNI